MRFTFDPENFDSSPQFNQWIDERYEEASGQLEILSFKPRPSEVLFKMNHATYVAAFSDFMATFDEDLRRTVIDTFPLPIAHYFYRFENGYENDLQRLHLLRDVWEATVDVLHALTVGEARFRGLALSEPLKFVHLLSDSIAVRLLNIERVVGAASAAGITLAVGNIVSQAVLQKMCALNQSRNAFSHSAAQSEAQARMWIGECYEDVLDVLDDIRALEGCKLVRYLSQVDGSTLRCELFKGHAFTRTIQKIHLTDEQAHESHKYFKVGQMLANYDGNFFSVLPHMFFQEDTEGHMTKPCMLRKTHGEAPNRSIEFAVVGNAVAMSVNRAVFKSEIDELRALFGLEAD